MQGRALAFAAALAATLFIAVPAALGAGTDTWTQWTASPQDTWIRSLDFTAATTLVASSDGDGIYQAAATLGPWAQTNGGLTETGALNAFQVVASGGKLYAATSAGLFTAPQGGGSWTQLGGGTGENKLNMGGIQSVVVESPASIAVAVAGAGGPGVYTTSDGGGTWTHASGMPIGENIFYLAKGIGPVIYAAGDSGVWTSLNGGSSWSLTSDGIDPAGTTFRVAVGSAPNELWAASGSNVYKSTNGGLSWVNVDGTTPTALPAAQLKAAFLLAPSLGAGDALVGTTNGVWASNDGGAHWGQMSTDTTTQAGLFGNRAVYALGVGFTPPALLAGTQGFGVYSLPINPVTAGSALTLDETSGLNPGDTLGISASVPYGFLGTLPFFYTYTWKKCTGNSCSNFQPIGNGGSDSSYTIPYADASTAARYEVTVCATNLVTFIPVCKTSAPTTGSVAAIPGSARVPLSGGTPSSISPDPHVSYPWGTTLTINPGDWGTEASPGTPASVVTFSYQWWRCDQSSVCTVIPGATDASYTTTADDVGDTIRGYVKADPFFSTPGSQFYEADETFTIIEKTPVNTVAPKIVGASYVGTTLSSTAGAWSAHDPTYTRRWLECNADGLQCQPLNPDQTGTTYTLTSADLGSRLELEVTATQPDPSQARVAVADSALTPVITNPPTAGGGSPSPTPTPAPSPKPAPKLGKLRFGHRGKTATIVFALTGAGAVRLTLQRVVPGHRVRNRCVKGKRKHARACTIYSTAYTIVRRGLSGGMITIPLATKVHGRNLPPGPYRVLVTPYSASGKAGSPRSINLVLVHR